MLAVQGAVEGVPGAHGALDAGGAFRHPCQRLQITHLIGVELAAVAAQQHLVHRLCERDRSLMAETPDAIRKTPATQSVFGQNDSGPASVDTLASAFLPLCERDAVFSDQRR